MKSKKKAKVKKNNALVMCHNRNQYWTTQKQFWQWIREGVIVKTGDSPLTGHFVRRDEEKTIILANAVLNLAHYNHLQEFMTQRKLAVKR